MRSRLLSVTMTSTVVLAQAESVANWLGVAGQWVGAGATVFVAYIVDRWQRQRNNAERHDRERSQAKLVTIAMDYSVYGSGTWGVLIINQSEQQVRWPRIESIGGDRPKPRVGPQVYLVDEDGEEIGWSPDEVLDPRRSTRVPFEPLDADGQPIDIPAAFMANTLDRYVPRVDDVTITFYMFDVQWWRVGNRDPVRVEPAPAGLTQTKCPRRSA